ncbi:MAG: LptF/LptG family permease [Candidatus Hydrogenedentes bacterium]|nr:LptF/LptG family permease [Candidatus Hydrogenedentota bacterium]
MSLINRYISRQIAVPALLALTAIAVVGVASEIHERSEILPIMVLTVGDVSRLTVFFLPMLVSYLVPITYMLGILLAFGKLAQNSEIVAMKAAGIPLKRIILPVILVGVALSGFCFIVQDRIQPWAVGRVSDLLYSELPLRLTLDVLPTGVMQDYAGWRIYIGKRDRRTHTFEKIIILKPEEGGRASAYYADSAQFLKEEGKSILVMSNVHLIPPGESGYVPRLKTDSMRLVLPAILPKKPPATSHDQSLGQLWANERDLRADVEQNPTELRKEDLQGLRREIADRLSMPFACFAVTLAAAPLGARARRSGRSYAFAVGTVLILVYYVLQMGGVPKGLVSLEMGILRGWLPNFALIGIGIAALWRVDRV